MHPGQPSGVVHPLRRRMNRCRRRRAGVAPTATPFSGIRCRYAAADSRGVARVPLTSIFLPVHICRPLASGGGLPRVVINTFAGRKTGRVRDTRIPAVRRGHVYSSPSSARAPYLRGHGRRRAGLNCGPFCSGPVSGSADWNLFVAADRGIRDDVDPPAGELGGEAGVLAFLADGEGELVVRDHNAGRAGCLVRDGDRIHP